MPGETIFRAASDDGALWRQIEDKGFADAAELAAAARRLTVRSPRTPQAMWRFKAIGSTAVKLRRAEDLRDRLATSRKAIQADIRSVDGALALALDSAIDDRDDLRLAALGLNTEYAWLGDVMRAIVAGEYVDVETLGPYASEHLDGSGRFRVSADNLAPDEKAGVMLARLIRDLAGDFTNVSLVVLLDEYSRGLGQRALSPVEGDLFVVGMHDILRRSGAILTDDVPGDRFVLLRESSMVPEAERMIAMLRDSIAGVVTYPSERDIVFNPSRAFIESLALHSGNRTRELRRRGIRLQHDGRLLCHTLDAASFLHPICHLTIHLKILDKRFAVEQDRAYALPRALDILRQDNVHDVFFDTSRLSPELVSYAVCRLLAREVDDLLHDLRTYDDWAAIDPEEYVLRNYGRRVLPEDRGIMAFVIDQIERAGLPDHAAPLVADVGAGPNFYPIMLLAPYVSDDGAIDLIEFTAANRGYTEGLLDEARTSAGTPQPWASFQDLMVEMGGDRYADAFERASALATVIEGSIYSLPKGRYSILSSYFVAESITLTRSDFHRAIRSLAMALRPDGILVAAHMLGSREWQAGADTSFPAVSLTVADIEEAYRSAGLEFAIQRFEAPPADKAREGYHGMAAVVARRAVTSPVARTIAVQRRGSSVPVAG
jgi:hypothetical protein